ncbi:MAG: hypothetical protein ACOY0T_10115 [Myxococcota bacterium]
MTNRCARWMELSDRQLLGERLSPRELEYLRSHEFDCSQCAREAAMFRELRPAPLHVVPSEAEIQRVLIQAELDSIEKAPRREKQTNLLAKRSNRWIAVGAAIVAAAASVVLLLRPWSRGHALASKPAVAELHASSVASATPAARAKEDSCGALLEGIVLCLAAGAEVGQVQLNAPHRFVELKRGRAVASLAPQPQGSSFSIVTEVGQVTAVGTIFSVEVGANRHAIARVSRGKVLVHTKVPGADQALLAGQKVQLGENAASGLPLSEGQRDLDLVARWSALGGDVAAHAEPALGDEEAKASETTESASSAQLPSKDELAMARQLRARGQFKRAAALYRSIYSRSPHSETGRAALVSLGSLQLSSLGDPRGALASFDAYLTAGSGALRQQAEYGRIRALRGLGRTTEELEASRKFITRYPNAPETRLLKESSATKHAR